MNIEMLVVVASMVGVLATTTLAIWLQQRALNRPGGRDGLGAIGDAFGGFIDVFDPGNARAARDLKEHENVGPVTPTPEDDDRPVRMVKDKYGNPQTLHIRR